MELVGMAARSLLILLIFFLFIRLNGKSTISQLSLFELIIAVMMAQWGMYVLLYPEVPLLLSLWSLGFVVLGQLISSHSTLSRRRDKETEPDYAEPKWTTPPTFPLDNQDTFQKRNYTLSSYETTEPLVLVEQGKVNNLNLDTIGKNVFWLKLKIKEETGISLLKEISFCSIDREGRLYIDLYQKGIR